MKEKNKKYLKIGLISGFSILAILLALLINYCIAFNKASPNPFSFENVEKYFAKSVSQKNEIHPLPYDVIFPNLNINASSCIVVDTSNGCILYEKNADEVIPPASMTKLVVMYIVFQEVATGRISLQDVVPLPKESWARNLPSDSSLMFLDEGQTITLHELLQGLAVCSGNDAAIAVAHYITGSVESFIERMNYEMSLLELTQTHFVEPSGYSELNVTTAREFAKFANYYINTYPESLTTYHSLLEFEYPKEHNLPKAQQGQNKTPIKQSNTNKALGVIEGVNGLKTGYIDESGYNLSLTAMRDGTQILSITMGGPGNGSIQGNKYRMEDATTITDYAFECFKTVPLKKETYKTVKIVGGKQKALNLIADIPQSLTVPTMLNNTNVDVSFDVPEYLIAPISTNLEYGKIVYSVSGTVLQEIPLFAEAAVDKSNFIECLIDKCLVK